MKTNALICTPDDYDFYTIPLSVKTLLHKQKNHFISSQLEKLHPCFSDNCSFDSHLKLERSGLKAQVVVMQKCTLAEFKSQKKRIFIEECRHIQFFTGNQKKLWAAFISVVIFLVAFTAVSIHQKKLKNEKQNSGIQEIQQIAQPEPLIDQPFFSPALLNHVTQSGGQVLNFSWSYDGCNESASCYIKGLFPEQIPRTDQITFSSVTFEQSVPEFAVNYSAVVRQTQVLSEYKQADYKPELRALLLQNDLVPAEETITPFGIKLLVPPEKCSVIEDFLDFLKYNTLSLAAIKLNLDNSIIKMEFIFSDFSFPNENELFTSVINILNAFALEQEKEQDQDKLQLQAPPQSQLQRQSRQLIKLGQIKKPDGSVAVFYKDENGKIIKR